jgi:DeoR/GlpR family transcriptional regulator of sugar metabolism
MAPSGLKIDTRRKRILELLERDGRVSVTRLSEELGATAVTIRSDLNALERNGYLERIQGGAIRKMRIQPQRPVGTNLPEKQAIAAATAKIIQNGDTLFLNSGTTTHQLAIALKEHRNLNVVTNSVAVAAELSTIATFRVILLGGELDPQYLYTCGGDAQEQLQKYQADYAILSLDGVSAESGITTYHADEAIIDKMMVEKAKKTLIVADHTKIGYAGFSLICPLHQVDTVITDDQCDPDIVQSIASQVSVITAKP